MWTSVRRVSHDWTVLTMQSLGFQVVPMVEVRLALFGDSWEKRTRDLRQRLEVVAIDATRRNLH
jgi:hypothetical protein